MKSCSGGVSQSQSLHSSVLWCRNVSVMVGQKASTQTSVSSFFAILLVLNTHGPSLWLQWLISPSQLGCPSLRPPTWPFRTLRHHKIKKSVVFQYFWAEGVKDDEMHRWLSIQYADSVFAQCNMYKWIVMTLLNKQHCQRTISFYSENLKYICTYCIVEGTATLFLAVKFKCQADTKQFLWHIPLLNNYY